MRAKTALGMALSNKRVIEQLYAQSLKELQQSGETLSLSVNTPGRTGPGNDTNEKRPDEYLSYLSIELRMIAQLLGKEREIKRLSFSRGALSYLDNAQMTELIYLIAAHLHLSNSDQREFSITIDPQIVSEDTLRLLKGLGFNCLILEVQSLDPACHTELNQKQLFWRISNLCCQARLTGFRSVWVELLFGLPEQNAASFETTINRFLDLRPDRVSLYNYADLPDDSLFARSDHTRQLPGAFETLTMKFLAAKKLRGNGYRYLGSNNFIRASDETSTLSVSGHTLQALGLGVSAISSLGDAVVQNHATLDAYYKSLDNCMLPIDRILSLSPSDKIRGDFASL